MPAKRVSKKSAYGGESHPVRKTARGRAKTARGSATDRAATSARGTKAASRRRGSYEGLPDDAELEREAKAANVKYERIKKAPVHLTELQDRTVAELMEEAKALGIKDSSIAKRQDLIFEIVRAKVRADGLLLGKGVLETLL